MAAWWAAPLLSSHWSAEKLASHKFNRTTTVPSLARAKISFSEVFNQDDDKIMIMDTLNELSTLYALFTIILNK